MEWWGVKLVLLTELNTDILCEAWVNRLWQFQLYITVTKTKAIVCSYTTCTRESGIVKPMWISKPCSFMFSSELNGCVKQLDTSSHWKKRNECGANSQTKREKRNKYKTPNKQVKFSHLDPTFGLELWGRLSGLDLGPTPRVNSHHPKSGVSIGLAKQMREPGWTMEGQQGRGC